MNVDDQIKAEKLKLVPVLDPTQVTPASIDVDEQLLKLASNLKILTNLIFICGNEATRLEYEYNNKRFKQIDQIDNEKLTAIGIVKSDLLRYLKLMFAEDFKLFQEMSNKHNYFKDTHKTYFEWVNIYKKMRSVPQ